MSTKSILLGLSGKSGSGKSSAAAYLEREHGFIPLAFADILKEAAQGILYFSAEQLEGSLKEIPDSRFGKSPRWCLQHLGSACREIWPEVWIWPVCRQIIQLQDWGEKRLLVSDVRLGNEAKALKRLGAVLWRLERPGIAGAEGGIPGYASETELDFSGGWDLVIANDGSLERLYMALDIYLDDLV